MADRSVVVRLRAEIGQYQAAMKKAQGSAREFGSEFTKTAKSGSEGAREMGQGMLLAGGAIALGLGKAVQTGMGFEKQMSGVRAVSGASADEMSRLSEAAIKAGASTKLAGVTASDAAAAEAELVKAGVSVADVLGGGLMGSLTLASAGQLEFADAATIAAQAMNIFDLRGSDVTHVADVLAAAANKSAADVGQLGDALRQGGLVASQTGLSLEETVGALAAFADNALIGSDAGTSLKTMLQRLTPQSKEAAGLMDELGFSAYDAQGNFVGLEGLAKELTDAFSGMTVEQRNSAMATLFGSDAVRGANVLYEEGADGIREYVKAVNDQGAAARMAAIQNDNLSGDLEALGGAIESVLIKGSGNATGALRGTTQAVTQMVVGFGALEGPLGAVGFGLAGVTGAASLAGGAALLLLPKIDAAKKALDGMGASGQFLSRNMGRMALGLGAAGVAIAGISYVLGENAEEAQAAEDRVNGYSEAIRNAGDATKGTADALRTLLGETPDLAGWMDKAGVSAQQLAEAANGTADEWEDMVNRVGAAGIRQSGSDIIGSDALASLSNMRDEVRQATSDAESLDNVLGETGEAASGAAGGLDEVGESAAVSAEAAKEAEEAFKSLMDAYRGAVDPLFGMLEALDANREAQASLNETLDSGEASAAEVDAAYRNVARSALDVEVAAAELNNEIANGNVTLDQAAAMLAEWVQGGLITEAQASQMADQFGRAADEGARIAPEYKTKVTADTLAAEAALRRVAAWQDAVNRSVIARVQIQLNNPYRSVPGLQLGIASGGLVPQYLAVGGMSVASGPRGTDTVPAWLTPGEFVMQKSAVDRYGTAYMEALNAGTIGAASGQTVVVHNNQQISVGAGADARQLATVVRDAIEVGTRRGIRSAR